MSTNKDSEAQYEQVLHDGEEYHSLFDTQAYLKEYYRSDLPHIGYVENRDESKLFTYRALSGVKGEMVLDLGSGPSINNHISAANWFNELIFSDFTASNREALQKWKDGEMDVFDWDPAFKHVAGLEGDEIMWETDKENFRKKMTDIYACDVRKDNPLHPVICEPFDCVTSFFCLEQACGDGTDFEQVIKNVSSLLKDGGVLILGNVLDETRYKIGGVWFRTLGVGKETIIKGVEKAGLRDIKWYSCQTPEVQFSDATDMYVLVARK
ncbi:nicotinamide N-methyltransferase [Lingula anatina]|uniref:Nicotinamide N-methyltransferase n=1 Tax=Lingula anatina TaxID=7574 RepID=A0A1S3GY32_LINAN|nr:nicotinamide N-methyltransferase [Lingula anatina]|eukprot:XP_013378780.1 nicotinamide N-methyltransferase [Lingula anatina]